MWAILSSTVIGFLSVIAAYVSPDTVFTFLLNSSGAVILFVYLLIAVSQFVLRRRTPDDQLTVKMWFFPVLTILAAVGIVAMLVQMGLEDDTRSQLLLSLLSWAVVLALYVLTRWRGGSVAPRSSSRPGTVRREDPGAGQPDDGERRAARARCTTSRAATEAEYFVVSRPTRSTPVRPSARAPRSCGRPPAGPPRSGSTRRCAACASRA